MAASSAKGSGDAVAALAGAQTRGVLDEATITAAAAHVAQQRTRLDGLRAKVRTLRAAAELAASAPPARTDDGGSSIVEVVSDRGRHLAINNIGNERVRKELTKIAKEEQRLQTTCRHGEVAVTKLRDVLASRQEQVAELRRRVADARGELRNAQKLEDERLSNNPSASQAAMLRQALANWDTLHGTKRVCSESFAHADQNHDGKLEWNNGEVRKFVRTFFSECAIKVPHWSDVSWYNIYRHFDQTSSMSLDLEEACRFVKFCFEVALRLVDPVGTAVEDDLAPTVASSAVSSLLQGWDKDPEGFKKVCHACFNQVDNGDGRLQWNNTEIRRYVRSLFEHFNVLPPQWPDSHLYDLYRRVDLDKDHAINLDEAVYFARMCFEDACGNLNLWMH